jgi:hypothetical protein
LSFQSSHFDGETAAKGKGVSLTQADRWYNCGQILRSRIPLRAGGKLARMPDKCPKTGSQSFSKFLKVALCPA